MGHARRLDLSRASRQPFWIALSAASLLVPSGAALSADDVSIPIVVAASLASKVCAYDRNMDRRAKERVLVLILVKPNVDVSSAAASELVRRLEDLGQIAGRPQAIDRHDFSSAEELARYYGDRRHAIIFFCPGFTDREIEAISGSLSGADVLTVATVEAYVGHGAVLGFDLVSGKPKIEVNLAQARRQHVEFRSELLQLAKVIE